MTCETPRSRKRTWPSAWCAIAALLCAGQATAAQIISATDVPYRLVRTPGAGRQQTLDLYLPRGTASPPLVIYLHGAMWSDPDDRVGTVVRLARFLTGHGAAVAVVRYRLAPAHRYPAQIDDAAAAVAFLLRGAKRFGFDPARVFLAGHSSGAHLAALMALDPAVLAPHGLSPGDFAGVIAADGLYDLERIATARPDQRARFTAVFGKQDATLRDASPARHVSGAGPPFLVVSAARDARVLQVDAREFAGALAAGGRTVDHLVVPAADHTTVMELAATGNPAGDWWLDFIGLQPLPQEERDLRAARRAWRDPPFSSEPFWQQKRLVRSYPVDKALYQAMLDTVRDAPEMLNTWSLRRYHAVDLLAWLKAQPRARIGTGEFLEVTNIRGERVYWRLADIAPLQPRLVIGLDDERNLFRITGFYRLNLERSWEPAADRPPLMARPLGAFVYFAAPGDARGRPVHAALTADSFRLTREDPLAAVRAAPAPVRKVLTVGNGCASCHAIKGQGARAHHVTAADGQPHGGYALSLEQYSTRVLWRFVFRQEDLARQFGITANVIDPEIAPRFYGWVLGLVKRPAVHEEPAPAPVG